MQFFTWNASFEIGIPPIDRQHRTLVDLINRLATAIADGGRLPQVETLIGELTEYATQHFADEERIMEPTDLSDGEKMRHRGAHRGFVEKVREIARRDDLLRADVSEQVLEFLVTWLVSHILGSDRKIAIALRSSGSDEPPMPQPSVEQVLIAALGETERRFRLISDYAPAMIWICDPSGTRDYANRAWTEFVGAAEDTAPGNDWCAWVHPDDVEAYGAFIRERLATPHPGEVEYRLRRADGQWRWVLERIQPRQDSVGTFVGLIASAVDITAIKLSEAMLARANRELEAEVARRTAEIERLMLTDPLTGVGNRRRLVETLERAIERARREDAPLGIVFLDLDHFKRINDRWGHTIGDRVLTRVAGVLRANVASRDTVCRYGGEEFVVVLEDTALDDCFKTAERLRAAIGRIRLIAIDEPISASAGLALWSPGLTVDTFLAEADEALYGAKQAGRDRTRIAVGSHAAA